MKLVTEREAAPVQADVNSALGLFSIKGGIKFLHYMPQIISPTVFTVYVGMAVNDLLVSCELLRKNKSSFPVKNLLVEAVTEQRWKQCNELTGGSFSNLFGRDSDRSSVKLFNIGSF